MEVKFFTFENVIILSKLNMYYFSAPGRKKKVVEEVKPACELSHPAEISTLSTENSSSLSRTSSAVTIHHPSSSSVIEHPSPLTTPDHRSSTAPTELHVSSVPDELPVTPVKTPFAAEHPCSSTSTKAPLTSISAETSSAEVSSLLAPTEVIATPEMTAGSLSPCPASSVSTVQVFEEETRMSAESGSRSQTPAHTLPPAGMVSRTKWFLKGGVGFYFCLPFHI
jgi:hypothetical protein